MQKQKNKQYYDEFFTNHPVDVHNSPSRFVAVSNLLSGKVLDVACGTGTLADYYLGDYVGVDISDVAIEKARQVRRKDAHFEVADFTKDSYLIHNMYDCAYLGEFLEHIEDDHFVFQNLKDVVKPYGKIFVTVPNGDRVPDKSHCRTFTVPQIREQYRKYGKIQFYDWEGFADRILFSIELGSENHEEITLVMCVKNEEKGIEKAIISALPLVDRVVVSVDGLSKDKTLEIAELYADRVIIHRWNDNFSEMRNGAQAFVKTPWTLFLDGHEYIESMGNIREMLSLDVDALVVYVKMENGTKFMYPRIFKSHLKFENAVHNALDPKTQQYAPKFVIVHDREHLQSAAAAEERARQRDRMIPKLMKEALQKNPNDQRALFNLGNWYLSKFEMKLALKFYKRCYKLTPTHDEKYFIKAQIGIAQQLLGQHFRALMSYYDLEKLIPDRWETKRLIAGIYMEKGQYKKAVNYLTFCLEPNKYKYLYTLFGHDLSELWDLIASCYLSMEEPERAVIAWEEAAKWTEDETRKGYFNTKKQLAAMLVKNPQAVIDRQQLQSIVNPLKKNNEKKRRTMP